MSSGTKFNGGAEFRAASVKEALSLARAAYGDEALILGIEKLKDGQVLVKATTPQEAARSEAVSRAISTLHDRWGSALDSRSKESPSLSNPDDLGAVFLRSGFSPTLSMELERMASALAGAPRDRALRAISHKIDQNAMNAGPAPLTDGGLYALVGPTGSGKTTTAAKMAARAVSRWGSDAVALITTDFYRIGAYEQLKVYAELLKVELFAAKSQDELIRAVNFCKGRKLVLIDTIGANRIDEKTAMQMQWLAAVGARSLMTLQGSLARDALREDVGRWASLGATEGIITKLDECDSIAPLLDCALSAGFAVRAVTNGQRVPEDLHWISGSVLAHKAMKAVWNDLRPSAFS